MRMRCPYLPDASTLEKPLMQAWLANCRLTFREIFLCFARLIQEGRIAYLRMNGLVLRSSFVLDLTN